MFQNFNLLYYFRCRDVSMHVCMQRPEEGIRSLGTGVTDGCELPCGCWEWNPGPLQEQQLYLIPKPSLQVPRQLFWIKISFGVRLSSQIQRATRSQELLIKTGAHFEGDFYRVTHAGFGVNYPWNCQMSLKWINAEPAEAHQWSM